MRILIYSAIVLVIVLGAGLIMECYGKESHKHIDKCKEFCTIIGEEYGNVVYSGVYNDFICMCKHTDTVEYNNTTYKLIRLLDYGVVKNVTQ
ncbi:MAG TPA: hypothetical protein ENG63_05350 [Candidatus Desulfofervidus auxilii]|uniref:Uncharacterized protein n=1 Tax=Desulfofervidus auxilii TaxID=1621989 RepID=A0A7C0Y5N5_DESA2|nr:hypothetical protein [Candidatus Desulfofervidus auxilii]